MPEGYIATVRVTGSVGRFEDFRECIRWLLVRDPDCDPYTEHHAEGTLEYRFSVHNGIPFPSFVEASTEFPEMRIEVQWQREADAGGAAIENGCMVDRWRGERNPA
ncbi:MAG: hypothetical protein FJY43_02150 [Betaproteobacteria bacterium]|nr:hypothetical protein [Betaproteobacteria bacterium]